MIKLHIYLITIGGCQRAPTAHFRRLSALGRLRLRDQALRDVRAYICLFASKILEYPCIKVAFSSDYDH